MSNPKLRFPEFNSEWRVERLGHIAKKINQRNESSSANTVLTNSAVRGVIPQAEFFDKEIAVQGNLANYYIARKDDFIYNPRMSSNAPVGPFKRNHFGDGVVSPLYNLFRFNEDETLDYFEQYFNATYWHKYMKDVANSGARSDRMAIVGSDLMNLPFPYPTRSEREKIASFFTTLDDRIYKSEDKVKLLREYRNGLARNLLSKRIQFTDSQGSAYSHWQEVRIEDIAYKENSSLSANDIVGKSGHYKVYGASGQLQTLDTYDQKDAYIAIVKDGAGVGRLMRCDKESSVLGTLSVIKPKNEIDYDFLFVVLESINFKKYITGSTIPHIYFRDYSKEKIILPSIEEQRKIASLLIAFDDKIKAENDYLLSMKLWKKGLLQRMFV